MTERIGRREAVAIGALGVLGLFGGGACKQARALSCSGVSDLTVPEVELRNRLAYVDRSPDPGKKCEDCQQFVAPPTDGECGGCKVMKGSIHPGGTCKSFMRKG